MLIKQYSNIGNLEFDRKLIIKHTMKNCRLPCRMRIECLIYIQILSTPCQKKTKRQAYAGRVEVVWTVIETASSSRSCMSNGHALDKLNLCAYFGPCIVLYLFLFFKQICSMWSKSILRPSSVFVFFSIWNIFALDKLNLHFMWAKSICRQTLELVYQFSSKFQLLVFFLTN